jgi:hypothetical protein
METASATPKGFGVIWGDADDPPRPLRPAIAKSEIHLANKLFGLSV